MTTGDEIKHDVGSVTSAGWFVAGGVLSVLSASVLAWSGTVCVDVLKVLMTREIAEVESLGWRLGRVSWCPLGVAVGTTLIAAGFRRSLLRGRLSRRCLGWIALYGALAACGAFFIVQGTSLARNAMWVVATSSQAIKSEELLATVSHAATAVSRGWMLFAVAQILLTIGGLVQFADQAKSFVGVLQWPKSAHMALSLLWIFGAVASVTWFLRSGEILRMGGKAQIKASEFAEMINGVLSISSLASLFLLGHAVLTTVVAMAAYRFLARSRLK